MRVIPLRDLRPKRQGLETIVPVAHSVPICSCDVVGTTERRMVLSWEATWALELARLVPQDDVEVRENVPIVAGDFTTPLVLIARWSTCCCLVTAYAGM